MYKLDIYHRVRRAVRIDGMSERAAAIAFGIDRGTVSKMLEFSEPPGYRLTAQRPRSRMDEHAAFVDQILIDDQDKPKKQRHTVQRIFERLRPSRPIASQSPVGQWMRRILRAVTQRYGIMSAPAAST